jgi:hypothetical protein
MVADRYAGDTTWTKRIVREHYDQPVPKTNRGLTAGDDAAPVAKDRAAARAKATADR